MNRKGFANIIVIALIGLVVVAGMVYFIAKQNTPTIPSSALQNTESKPAPDPSQTQEPPTLSNSTSSAQPSSSIKTLSEIVFKGEIKTSDLISNVEARIIEIGKYFADEQGNLSIVGLPSVSGTTLQYIFKLTPDQVVLTADVDFANLSLDKSVTIDASKNFRVEIENNVYYERRAGSNTFYDRLTLLPRTSQQKRLFFTIPKDARVVEFWYGTDLSNFVGGFTIDFNSKLVEPFKG